MSTPTDAELIDNLKELAELAALDGAGLRAQIEREAADRLAALSAEVERLREALKVYADEKNWHCTEFGEYHEHGEKCCKDGWWTRSEHGYDVAREAIKENQSENRVCE